MLKRKMTNVCILIYCILHTINNLFYTIRTSADVNYIEKVRGNMWVIWVRGWGIGNHLIILVPIIHMIELHWRIVVQNKYIFPHPCSLADLLLQQMASYFWPIITGSGNYLYEQKIRFCILLLTHLATFSFSIIIYTWFNLKFAKHFSSMCIHLHSLILFL